MTLQDKIFFYQKLHTGIKAGMTLPQVLAAQLLPPSSADAVARLRREIDRGTSVAKAFTVAGLVSPWEAELIRLGEETGRLEAVLAQLDDYFSATLGRLKQIKSKLVYPLLVLLFAITVLPLPGLFAGSLDIGTYCLQVVLGVLLLALIYRMLLVKPFTSAAVGPCNNLLYKSLGFVSNSHFLRLQFDIAYLDLLTLCLESGLDAVKSLKLMQGCLKNKKYKKSHAFAISKIDKGGSMLSDALESYAILKHPQVLSFLASSEHSGTLHSDLREFVVRKKQDVESTLDFLMRSFSALVTVAVMAYAAFRVLPLLKVILGF